MASILTSEEKTVFKAAFDDLFDTFKQDIVVYKDAQIVLTDEAKPRMFGYNERVDISNINYIPVTGVFPALVSFGKKQGEEIVNQIGNRLTEGQVSIKVKSDCKDFILNNGRTINISINDLMFKVISSESQRRFITPDYSIFILEREK